MKDKNKKHQYNNHHDNSYLSIDYCASKSGISDWNPSFKVFFAVLLTIISIASNSICVAIMIFLATSYITLFKGKVELYYYLELLLIPVSFALLSSIAIIIGFSKLPVGDYNIKIFSIYMFTTKANIYKAVSIFIRAFGAISSVYMMNLSTTSYEIINVLRNMKVPGIVIELMNMIYRYIFILMEVQNKMRISAGSRLGYCDLKTSYKSFCGISINLFVISFKKASQYYDALESRCYDGELNFLYEEKKVNKKHILAASFFVLLLIIIRLLVKF